ncbi:MAG TPA: hypothetical protein DDY31_07675 [Lachnospiraceae bacterium]|nr:hypothetical protein [Lachnospiraceae bacterium]
MWVWTDGQTGHHLIWIELKMGWQKEWSKTKVSAFSLVGSHQLQWYFSLNSCCISIWYDSRLKV